MLREVVTPCNQHHHKVPQLHARQSRPQTTNRPQSATFTDFVLAYEQKNEHKVDYDHEKKKSISRKKFLMGLLRAGVEMERVSISYWPFLSELCFYLILDASTGKIASSKLATSKLVNSKLANGKLATGKLETDKLATGKLANGKLATVKLATGELATGKLATDKLVTGKLAMAS